MKLERRIQEFIHEQQLFAEHAGILVALSGGADSVALLRILTRLGYHCHAVHCNFHLRNEESDRDEQFALALCREQHVTCEVVHFDTRRYAAEHHVSIEMAARELRYREFERIRKERGLDVIAVAHHSDDAVETLLLNLVRGTGINGLTGMHAINGHVVRPLLCVSRDELIAYLNRLGQCYVTDSTNLIDEYARNKIRLRVLPVLEEINPAAKKHILQAAERLAEVATIYNEVMAPLSSSPDNGQIPISTLLDSAAPRAMLFELLRPYGFNSAQTADIFRSLSAEAGRVFHSAEYTLLRDRTHLVITHKSHDEATLSNTTYTLPDEGTLTLPDGTSLMVTRLVPDEGWQLPREADVVCLDAARLNGRLTVRHPREGDRFRPFGMRGTKLLSDFYTDLKLPRTEKARQWLLCHGDDIVWTVGKRSSESYRLTGEEKEIIMIREYRQ